MRTVVKTTRKSTSENTGKMSMPAMPRRISLYMSLGSLGGGRLLRHALGRRRLDVRAEPLQIGDERDDLAVGRRVEPRLAQARRDALGLRAQVVGGAPLEALRIRHTEPAQCDHLALGVAGVERLRVE